MALTQLPQYGLNGIIKGYGNGNGLDPVATAPIPANSPYFKGGSGVASPTAPVAPTVAGFNGSNPATPASPLPSYSLSSLTSTIPGFDSSPLGSQFNGSATTSNTATATSPFALPSYAQPAQDPRIDALNTQSYKNISQGLNGQLPGDVQNQIAQSAAERGISTGIGSANTNAAFLRAMGLTSLDLTKSAQAQFQPIQLANISENGDNFRAIFGAKSALDQLNASQAGETSRFNAGQINDFNKQVLSGQQALQQLSAKGHQDLALALVNATAQQQDTILKGAQAMQQLQASESGQSARLDASLAADLQKQIVAGQQALAQINASGANQRANTALSNQGGLDQILAKYSGQANINQQASNQYAAGYNAGVPSGEAAASGSAPLNENAGAQD